MSEKKPFDAAIKILFGYTDYGTGTIGEVKGRSCEAAIRVLEAAGKVNKTRAIQGLKNMETIGDFITNLEIKAIIFPNEWSVPLGFEELLSRNKESAKEIRALLESLPEKGERIKTKIPLEVVFPGNPEIPPEKVAEYVYMPSGDIVVRVEGGDSLWFNKHGIHPKSRLIFKED